MKRARIRLALELTLRATVAVAIVAGTLVAVAAQARAQSAPTARERLERAIERYETALATTDAERRRAELEAALAELDEANRLEPSALIDFNLALVEHELGRPVAALEHVERFVAAVPGTHARRAEAEALLGTLRTRVASIWIDTEIAGATIVVNGEPRGTTPLGAWLRVPAGEVVVTLSAAGYRAGEARVRVAGETTTHVPIALEREVTALGELRIESPLALVEVTVDGEARGTTPLDASIALTPGPHVVTGTRAGYRRFERVVDIAIGAEATLALAMTIDEGSALGRLVLNLPDARATLSVDGAAVLLGPSIALPVGPHQLLLDVEERELWTGTVDVSANGTTELTPELRFSEVTAARLRERAEIQRVTGMVTMAAGAAAFVAGAALVVHALADTLPAIDSGDARLAYCNGPTRPSCPDLLNVENHVSELRALSEMELGLGGALGAAGAVALGVGLWAFLDAPSDDAIASRARARLEIGPASLGISGSF